MIKLSKLTDYGFVVLNRFAADGHDVVRNAPELAEETGLPLPTVSKLLKTLTRGGLLTARRGAKGGYSLARPAPEITAIDVIGVLEGPVALTECSGHGSDDCSIEHQCRVRSHWVLISEAVRQALDRISLADMAGAPEVSERRLAVPHGPRHEHDDQIGGCAGGGGCGSAVSAPCACGSNQGHTTGEAK